MLLVSCVCLALATAADAEVLLLSGETHSGVIAALQGGELILHAGDGAESLRADEVLEIRFPQAAVEDTLTQQRSVELRLVDGTLLYATSCTATGRDLTIASEVLGDFTVPLAQVRSVRFGELEPKIREAWETVRLRDTKTDLLVARKGEALDFVGGVVGGIAADSVKILVNDREAAVPRERVFGLVFPRTPPARDESVGEVALDAGDRLRLRTAALTAEELTGTLVAGPQVSIPLSRVRSIDFGLGRVRYLADLAETATYEPVGFIASEEVQKVRKNSNSLGAPIQVGPKTYARGLWIHSGTTLRYRLNRDFRRLQTVLGIERSADNCARLSPVVHVTILADGKSLFDAEVAWGEEPHDLNLDVAGVRELEIRVVPAKQPTLGACEHLALADARVVK